MIQKGFIYIGKDYLYTIHSTDTAFNSVLNRFVSEPNGNLLSNVLDMTTE